MKKTINCNQLNPGAIYLVRGKVSFSRITRHTTDKERDEANKRRMHPIDKNYTTITLYDAVVLARDPQNPSIEERYASECLYKSSSQNYPNNNFSAINKSPNLPQIAVLEGNNQYKQIIPENELAQGLDVTLVMRVYKTKMNNGVSLDKVFVNEPIKYYTGNQKSVDNALAGYGIVFQALPPTAQTESQIDVAEAEAAAAAPDDFAQEANFATNSFAPMNTPTQQAPVMTPVSQPAMQQASPYMTSPVPGNDNPFTSYQAMEQAAPMTFGPGPDRQY